MASFHGLADGYARSVMVVNAHLRVTRRALDPEQRTAVKAIEAGQPIW
jgi:hypothetical protein